jgi:hypothetical protein
MVQHTYPDDVDRLETRETGDMISSRKIEGTSVYDRREEHIGSIESFMVNKISGQVEYAVLQFGGFLGIGSDYYPLPWNQLRYSANLGGYVVDIDRTVLDKAPRYSAAEEPQFDPVYGRRINDYYGGLLFP